MESIIIDVATSMGQKHEDSQPIGKWMDLRKVCVRLAKENKHDQIFTIKYSMSPSGWKTENEIIIMDNILFKYWEWQGGLYPKVLYQKSILNA